MCVCSRGQEAHDNVRRLQQELASHEAEAKAQGLRCRALAEPETER